MAAGEDAGLVLVDLLPLHQIPGGDLRSVRSHGLALRWGGKRIHQGMLRRQHHVGGTEQGVRPGGEHADGGLFRAVGSGDGKVHLRALAAPNPIGLRLLGDFGPVDFLQVVQQLLRVLGDLEEPLRQLPRLHDGLATLAQAAEDLFVGQHRLAGGAPVDRRLPPLHQAAPV